jgi:signal transduction histidine kinase
MLSKSNSEMASELFRI